MNLVDNPAIRSLIDIQEHPFVLIDSHFRIVAANQAYRETYGITSDHELVGRPCYAVSHHMDQPCYVFGEDCSDPIDESADPSRFFFPPPSPSRHYRRSTSVSSRGRTRTGSWASA